MAKLYVVEAFSKEDVMHEPIGVYSSKEKMNEAISKDPFPGSDYWYSEFSVDSWPISSEWHHIRLNSL